MDPSPALMRNQADPVFDGCATFVGGASVRFPLREESLTSDATLAESESRSSHDPAALSDGLRLQLPNVWNGNIFIIILAQNPRKKHSHVGSLCFRWK